MTTATNKSRRSAADSSFGISDEQVEAVLHQQGRMGQEVSMRAMTEDSLEADCAVQRMHSSTDDEYFDGRQGMQRSMTVIDTNKSHAMSMDDSDFGLSDAQINAVMNTQGVAQHAISMRSASASSPMDADSSPTHDRTRFSSDDSALDDDFGLSDLQIEYLMRKRTTIVSDATPTVAEVVDFGLSEPQVERLMKRQATRKRSHFYTLGMDMSSDNQPAKSCSSRVPLVGDEVCTPSEKHQCTDAAGNKDAWLLHPGEVATVTKVDADGDFQLRNPSGLESAIQFAHKYLYKQKAELDPRFESFDVQPPKSCSSRVPLVGDEICTPSEKHQCTDAAGNKDSWLLHPGEIATVTMVDADGDFRLRNPSGLESAIQLRAKYVYMPQA